MTVTSNIHYGLPAWVTGQSYFAGNRVSSAGSAYQASKTGVLGVPGTDPAWQLLSTIDFISLAAWASSLPATLVDQVVAQVWNDGPINFPSGAGAILSLSGHVTTPTFNIVVKAAPGESWRDALNANRGAARFDPNFGVAFVLPQPATPTDWIFIDDSNVTINGLQFQDPNPASASSVIGASATVGPFTVSNCVFDGYAQASGGSLVGASAIQGPFLFHDNLVVDRQGLNDKGLALGVPGGPNAHDIARCTFVSIYGNQSGAAISGNNTAAIGAVAATTLSVRNSAFVGYVLPITNSGKGTATVDHCAFQYPSYMFPSGGFIDIGANLFSVDFTKVFKGPALNQWPIPPYDFTILPLSPVGQSSLFRRGLPDVPDTNGETVTAWHFSPNRNFINSNFDPGVAGFNIADISSLARLNALPAGVKGMVFTGYHGPADAGFIALVAPYIGNPKVFGWYIMDDAQPSTTPEANLAAQAAYLTANFPGTINFIVPENLGSWFNPVYGYTYAGAGVEYWGIDNYCFRPGYVDPGYAVTNGANLNIVDTSVNAALACGCPQQKIIPLYQAFGAASPTSSFSTWTMPTVDQTKIQLRRWGRFNPTLYFDYAYSWGIQTFGGNPEYDDALELHPELQAVYLQHNTAPVVAPVVYQDIGCAPFIQPVYTAIVVSCVGAADNRANNSGIVASTIGVISCVGTAGQVGVIITDPTPIFLQPNVPKPAYLVPTVEPTFMTITTRVGGDALLS